MLFFTAAILLCAVRDAQCKTSESPEYLKKKTTRIQKHFPLSVFVFIDSLVVSASQDAGGHKLSRQNNLTFGIGLYVVGARTVVRTIRHNQIFSDG